MRKFLFFLLLSLIFISCGDNGKLSKTDFALKNVIENNGLSAKQEEHVSYNKAQFELGKLLFFDKILSGNKDISCATCHHPRFGTVDCLSLGIGTKGKGLCNDRVKDPDKPFIPRNAPDIYNRGLDEWNVMFWDGRVEKFHDGTYRSPENDLPRGINSPLSAQALFPPTSPAEMKGFPMDYDTNGFQNVVAMLPTNRIIWTFLVNRVVHTPGYLALLKKAYPNKQFYEISDLTNAIALYEKIAFTTLNSPWDRYVSGDLDAISEDAKEGALLFYGKAKCSKCHSGMLFTDQKFHNIGIPQFGPGKNDNGLDYGRYNVTNDPNDKYKFRTPPLRNLLVTGPYTHNGAYNSLFNVIKHHTDPEYYLRNYNPIDNGVPIELLTTLQTNEDVINDILSTVDVPEIDLTDGEINLIIEFLKTLVSPDVYNEDKINELIPKSVPSGLPVDDVN